MIDHPEQFYLPDNSLRTQVVDGGFLTWKYGVSPYYGNWGSVKLNYRSALIMMDGVGKTVRELSFPAYKSKRRDRLKQSADQRKKRARVKGFQEIVRMDGMLTLLEIPGLEADDLVAWYFLWLQKQGQRLASLPEVVSVDKDFYGVPKLHKYMTKKPGDAPPYASFPPSKYPKYAGSVRNARDFLLLQCCFGDPTDSVPRLLPRSVTRSRDLIAWAKEQDQPFLALRDRLGRPFLQNLLLLVLPGPFLLRAPLGPADTLQLVEEGRYWDSELFLSLDTMLGMSAKRKESWW